MRTHDLALILLATVAVACSTKSGTPEEFTPGSGGAAGSTTGGAAGEAGEAGTAGLGGASGSGGVINLDANFNDALTDGAPTCSS